MWQDALWYFTANTCRYGVLAANLSYFMSYRSFAIHNMREHSFDKLPT